jgi:hypothetical protein
MLQLRSGTATDILEAIGSEKPFAATAGTAACLLVIVVHNSSSYARLIARPT